jgi:glycine/D-amino acid oxidase-like deaminating enzyme
MLPVSSPSYARSINIGRMIAKTIEIYEGLEAETGQHVGWHKCGQLRIANTRDRLDEYKSYMSVCRRSGHPGRTRDAAGSARALAVARKQQGYAGCALPSR